MAYFVNEECVMCMVCTGLCPVEAISEGEERVEIDNDMCIDCAECLLECPFGAIYEL